jgi:hypothetical protein
MLNIHLKWFNNIKFINIYVRRIVINGSLTMGTNDIISVGTITSSENIITTLTETSSSTTTGALQVAGGAGIGSLYVASSTTLNSSTVLNGSLTMGTNDIVSVGKITSSERNNYNIYRNFIINHNWSITSCWWSRNWKFIC